MIATIWLKIEGKQSRYCTYWECGNVTAFKSKPNTRDNEISFKLTLEIPDDVFEEPVFEAKLVLPNTTRALPDLTEIGKSVASELTKQMGFRVKLEMPTDETGPI